MTRIDRSIVADQDDGAERSQRAKGRDSLFLTGLLSLPDENKAREVRVRNLSEGGLMIEIKRDVAPGTALTLSVRGLGDLSGRVAWCAEGRIGVALDRAIDPKLARKPVGGGQRTPQFAKPLLG